MPKRIVILLDGTSNQISKNRTNVLRLYGALEKTDDQLVYYDPGVGTLGAENAWLSLWRKAGEVWGLLTGWGLDQNVKEAYRFLVDNYDNGKRPGEQDLGRDEIWIFGFSRGAYSARVLAGFIRAFGVVEPRNANLIDYAYRAYKRIGEKKDDTFGEIRLYERVLRPDQPPIRFLGLFDTVSSVFEMGRYIPQMRNHAFTANNTSVQTVRHAVAIDERRSMFPAQLWPSGQEYRDNPHNKGGAVAQDSREVWFAGVHADVGGGYPEVEAGLAKIPLVWIIEQAQSFGLKFKTRTINSVVLGETDERYCTPDETAMQHNSMKFAWALLEFLPRFRWSRDVPPRINGIRIPLFSRRPISDGSAIHVSVKSRMAKTGYAPKNLPDAHEIEPAGPLWRPEPE